MFGISAYFSSLGICQKKSCASKYDTVWLSTLKRPSDVLLRIYVVEQLECICSSQLWKKTQEPMLAETGHRSTRVPVPDGSETGLLDAVCSAAQSCPTLCDSMDCSLPGSSVHGILQASILEWVAISSSRASSLPRIKHVSPASPALAGGFFTTTNFPVTH